MIPPPSKMDTTGDQASNWEFFKDGGKNYASATKLDQKDKKIVAARLLSIMGKECLHVCRNGRKSTTQNGTNWHCFSRPWERNPCSPQWSTQESSQDQELQILPPTRLETAQPKHALTVTKKNHLAKVCRSTPKQSNEKPKKKSKDERQRVNQLSENGALGEPDSNKSIYSLQSPGQKKQYITEILVTANKTKDNIPIKFQVDTGASCSTITLKDYKKITHETLEKSNVKLKLYYQSLIQPTGSTKLYCTASGMRNCWACIDFSTFRKSLWSPEAFLL